jgi:hypothetical protein
MKVSMFCGALLVAGLVGLQSPAWAQQRNSSTYTPKTDALAPAKKAVAEARVEVNKVQQTMNQIKLRLQRSMETKDDWKAAKAARDQAHAQYDVALRAVMDNLKKNPEFISAMKRRDDLQSQVDAAGSGGKLSTAELDQLAADRSKAGLAVTGMEKTAKDNDPKLLEAKAKVEQADTDWKALLQQVDEAVKTDPEYAKAEKDLEAANEKYKQAQTSLASQVKSQRDAELASEKAKASSRRNSSGSTGGGYGR